MTDNPLPEDEPGAEERFERAIKNALVMKPTPHKPAKPQTSAPNEDAAPNDPEST